MSRMFDYNKTWNELSSEERIAFAREKGIFSPDQAQGQWDNLRNQIIQKHVNNPVYIR